MNDEEVIDMRDERNDTLFRSDPAKRVDMQEEECQKASPPRAEDTDNFVEVVFHIRGKHMGEDRRKEDTILR
jgi:hypothetical protein